MEENKIKSLETLPTGLELVEDLKSFVFDFDRKSTVDCLYVSGALNIIEKSLKDYEKLKEEKLLLSACRDLPTLEKKLKVLEIIEKSGLSFEHLLIIKGTKNYKEYSKLIETKYEPFKFEIKKSQQEYDLLKEELL